MKKFILFLILFSVQPASADILKLWNGSSISGILLAVADDVFVFRTPKGTILIKRRDIKKIEPAIIPDDSINKTWISSIVHLHENYGVVLIGHPVVSLSEGKNIKRSIKSSLINAGFYKRPIISTHWLYGIRFSSVSIEVLPEYNRQLWLGHIGISLQYFQRVIGDGFFLDLSAGGSLGIVFEDGEDVSKSNIGFGMELGGGYSIPLSARASAVLRLSWYLASNDPRFNTIGISGGIQW